MIKRYIVDFYDMIGGWGTPGWYGGFDTFEEAKTKCDGLQSKLHESNKCAGEHYGVIDMTTGMEVYCTMGK